MGRTHAIYLFWPPLGPEPLERFAASYTAHSAGIAHRLMFVLKGPADESLRARFRSVADACSAETLAVPPVGVDLDTYRVVADQLDTDYLCLLNTSSVVLVDGWLAALRQPFTDPAVGLVGCTGTFESSLSAAPRPLRPFLRSRYPRFPNPHIRTNAFMLRRELMLGLDWTAGTKRRALALESGTRGITRQVQMRGLQTLVVGRDRRSYPPEEWEHSHTFRSGDQRNLLVSDNRTQQYEHASPERRAELSRYAWGESAAFKDVPPE